MGIIDIHTHIGRWDDNNNFSVMDLCNVMRQNKVDYFMVSNLDAMGVKPDGTTFLDEKEANEKLLKAFKSIPQALLYAICNPSAGSPDSLRYLLTRKHKNKFIALKIHSEANQIPANSEIYDGYMKLAKDLDIPCLFHSGDLTSPYSSPELIYELAQRHPDVKVILGHLSAGSPESKLRAIDIIKESVEKNNSKLYCDISFCGPDSTIGLIQALPANIERILFGSDCPMVNMRDPHVYGSFLNNFVAIPVTQVFGPQSEDILYRILVGNAKKLFKIK